MDDHSRLLQLPSPARMPLREATASERCTPTPRLPVPLPCGHRLLFPHKPVLFTERGEETELAFVIGLGLRGPLCAADPDRDP